MLFLSGWCVALTRVFRDEAGWCVVSCAPPRRSCDGRAAVRMIVVPAGCGRPSPRWCGTGDARRCTEGRRGRGSRLTVAKVFAEVR